MAFAREFPRNMPVMIVVPERERPGKMPARTWAMPTMIAVSQEIPEVWAWLSLDSLDSAQKMKNAPMRVAAPTPMTF